MDEPDRILTWLSDGFDGLGQGGQVLAESVLNRRHRLNRCEGPEQVGGARIEGLDDVPLVDLVTCSQDTLAAGEGGLFGRGFAQGPVAILDDLVDDPEGGGVLGDGEARADAEAVAQNMVFFLMMPSRL